MKHLGIFGELYFIYSVVLPHQDHMGSNFMKFDPESKIDWLFAPLLFIFLHFIFCPKADYNTVLSKCDIRHVTLVTKFIVTHRKISKFFRTVKTYQGNPENCIF